MRVGLGMRSGVRVGLGTRVRGGGEGRGRTGHRPPSITLAGLRPQAALADSPPAARPPLHDRYIAVTGAYEGVV